MSRKKTVFIIFAMLLLGVFLWMQWIDISDKPTTVKQKKMHSLDENINEKTSNISKVELKVAVSMPENEFRILQKWNNSYLEKHPNDHIEMVNVPMNEANNSLKKRFDLQDSPDIALMDNVLLREFASLGYLHPVDDFFANEHPSKEMQSLITQVKWNGYIWGIPFDVDPYVWAWNTNVLQALKINQPPSTAEEMIAFNAQMIKSKQGNIGIYADPKDPKAMLALLWSLGAFVPAFDQEKTSTNAVLNWKPLVQFFNPSPSKSETKDSFVPYPRFPSKEAAWKALNDGDIAMMVTRLSDAIQHVDHSKTIHYGPMPTRKIGNKVKGTWLEGRSFVVSPYTLNTQEAFAWIKEMTSVEVELDFWNADRILPANNKIYQDNAIEDIIPTSVYRDVLREGSVLPVHPEMNNMIKTLQADAEKLFKHAESLQTFTEKWKVYWPLSKASQGKN